MWLAPAMLFLTTRTSGATVVGLLLVANTMRLLVSRSAPQEDVPVPQPQPRRAHVRMFRSAEVRPLAFRDRWPAISGAIALQACICAVWAGYPWVAALWLAVCAIIWTWSSKTQGLSRPREETYSLLSILVTLLLTMALSLGQFKADQDPPKLQAARKSATPVFTPARRAGASGKIGVTGVILRTDSSETKPRRRVWGGPPLPATSLSNSLTIPFTGEYHLFRTSSGRLPSDAIVDHGTPLDTLYATTNGEPLQMEAYQSLSPPLDVRNCGKIQMTISSNEPLPGIVLIQFLTAHTVEEVGIGLFGLNGASAETVDFTIPPALVNYEVSAIRATFLHNPEHSERNSRIAIQRFTLARRTF
jgi:hypothetical protein